MSFIGDTISDWLYYLTLLDVRSKFHVFYRNRHWKLFLEKVVLMIAVVRNCQVKLWPDFLKRLKKEFIFSCRFLAYILLTKIRTLHSHFSKILALILQADFSQNPSLWLLPYLYPLNRLEASHIYFVTWDMLCYEECLFINVLHMSNKTLP